MSCSEAQVRNEPPVPRNAPGGVAGTLRRIAVVVSALAAIIGCGTTVTYRELAEEYFNLGNAFYELGDLDQSFVYYTRALELDPGLTGAGYNLARVHIDRGNYERAAAVVDRLLEQDPANSLYRETRAYLEYESNDLDAARATYRALIDEFPGRARLSYNLALIEMEEERYREAATVLEAGRDMAEDDPEYLWLLAEAYHSADMPGQASTVLESFRVAVDGERDQLSRLAERYADWGFQLPALDVLESIGDTRGEPDLQFLQARLTFSQPGRFQDALDLLRSALEAGYSDTRALTALLDELSADDRGVVRALYRRFDIRIQD